MKIEKISDNKIKIVLLENEITRWSTVANTRIPDYNAMMLDLITAVEKETGISFRNCRVVVEATQGKNDSYVIFVTRDTDSKPTAHRIKGKTFRPVPKTVSCVVAEFESIETITLFDKHYPFYATLLRGNNTLYAYNDRYYLEITIPSRFTSYTESLIGNISEFSGSTSGTVIPYLLAEHAKCLIKGNALLTLRKI